MSLAQHIETADAAELTALASYLIGAFTMQETDPVDGSVKPAQVASLTSAFSAWAYMQQNAPGQGD